MVIGNVAYTMETIKRLSVDPEASGDDADENRKDVELQTKRDHLRLYVEEHKDNSEYFFSYYNQLARAC